MFVGQSSFSQQVMSILEAGWKTGHPVLLWGDPGIGKTALIKSLSEKYNLPMYILIGSTMDPTEVEGLPALKAIKLQNGDEATITENTLQYWARELIDYGKGILFFDEINNAPGATQSALLATLNERKVGRYYLPKNVWMIGASNYIEQAADGYELAAPTANRFIHIDYHLELEDFYEGMSQAWGSKVSVRETEERVKIVSFLKQFPALVHKMPTDSHEAGGAWPSPRSWNNASEMLALIDDPAARSLLLKGAVGQKTATQFLTWERTLKLPKYEDVIRDPRTIEWEKLSASEIVVMLSMVIERMTEENLPQTITVFSVIAKEANRPDLITMLGKKLMTRASEILPNQKNKIIILMTKLLGDALPIMKMAGFMD